MDMGEELLELTSNRKTLGKRKYIVFDADDMLDGEVVSGTPAIGVAYVGSGPTQDAKAKTSGCKAIVKTKHQFAIILVVKKQKGDKTISSALELLEDFKKRIHGHIGTSGHMWSWEGDQPIFDPATGSALYYMQHWTTKSVLKGLSTT